MKRVACLAAAAATLAGVVATVAASGQADGEAAPVFGITIPAGYRDWRMISLAQVGAPVNDLRVKLGNDVAIKAYRDGTHPFPDGTIIARLAYNQVASEENSKVFRAAAKQRGLPDEQIEKLLAASSVAGPPTNVQFMVKDSKRYASTGGWGFAQFTNGRPDGEGSFKICGEGRYPKTSNDPSDHPKDRRSIAPSSADWSTPATC